MSPSGSYMRIGTSTQPMPSSLIDELYAKRIHTTLGNIPSPRQDLTFAQLKIYNLERGLELNKQFANSLELLTPEGKYNYIGYLLADENGVSIMIFHEKFRRCLKYLVTGWNLHLGGLIQGQSYEALLVVVVCLETGS